MCPEPVNEVKIRAKWRQGIWGAADEQGKQAVGIKFPHPGGKAGDAKHRHEDKGTDDLRLVFSRPAGGGIESGKVFHNGIEVKQLKPFERGGKFKAQPSAL